MSDLRARVQQRLDALKITPRAASLAAGMGDSVVRDLFRRPDNSITVQTIEKLAVALKADPGWLAFGVGPEPVGDLATPSMRHLALDAPRPFRLKSFGQAQHQVIGAVPGGLRQVNRSFSLAQVDGDVAAGHFRPVEEFDDDTREMISAPRDPDFPLARQVAYKALGDSMNDARPRPINAGDYLICALWEDLSIEPETGMVVVVQQTTNRGRSRERSVKELVVEVEAYRARPRSTSRHDELVFPKGGEGDDGREVAILALVRFVFDHRPLGLLAEP